MRHLSKTMASPNRLRLGTRSSPLAHVQSEEILTILRAVHPNIEFETVPITTQGDRDQKTPLTDIGRGLFVKELELALLREEIDFAVHSAKDLPTQIPIGLVVAAITKRADPRDVLVDKWHVSLKDLPEGAHIGTGSPRRTVLLKAIRPDLKVSSIRGNVGTRIDKVKNEEYDGVILAAAGLLRLGRLEEAADYLDPEEFVPDAGQGALIIETREKDQITRETVRAANHPESALAVRAERAFINEFDGGCTVPVAAYVTVEDKWLHLVGFAATTDQVGISRSRHTGMTRNPEEAGQHLANKLLVKDI